MSFDLTWIRSFIALARTRNFSKAAAQTNVTQPAFSRRIRALEAWLGSDLIDRSTYPTRLTPAGERFLDVADDIDQRLAEVRAEIAEAGPAERPKVVIAAQHTLACSFLPAHLGELRAHADSPLCVVHAENIHDCSERLIAGNADILLAFAPANGPPRLAASDVECRHVGRDRLIPVVAPDPAGGPRHALEPARGDAVPWLSYGEGTLLEPLVCERIHARGLAVDAVVRNPITEVLRRFAVAGHGVGWLPQSIVADDLAAGALVQAADASWTIELPVCAYRLAQEPNPAVQAIWSNLPSETGP